MIDISLLMLVEDNDADVDIALTMIKRSKLHIGNIIVAHTLPDAIRAIEVDKVDVVLLDLNLGEHCGMDTLKTFRPLYSGIIIVLTGKYDEKISSDCIKYGAEDFLVKDNLTEERLKGSLDSSFIRHLRNKAVKSVNEKLDKLEVIVGGK